MLDRTTDRLSSSTATATARRLASAARAAAPAAGRPRRSGARPGRRRAGRGRAGRDEDVWSAHRRGFRCHLGRPGSPVAGQRGRRRRGRTAAPAASCARRAEPDRGTGWPASQWRAAGPAPEDPGRALRAAGAAAAARGDVLSSLRLDRADRRPVFLLVAAILGMGADRLGGPPPRWWRSWPASSSWWPDARAAPTTSPTPRRRRGLVRRHSERGHHGAVVAGARHRPSRRSPRALRPRPLDALAATSTASIRLCGVPVPGT